MDAVKKAILGEVLEEEEAYEVMRALMAGEVSPVRAAGLLVALRPGPCGRRRGP